MKSTKIIRYYEALVYWCDGLRKAAACYKAVNAGVEYTEEERAKMHEASRLLLSAQKLVNEVYAKRIVEAVAFDIRVGDWKGK